LPLLVAVPGHRPEVIADQFPDLFDRCLYKPAFQDELKRLLADAPHIPNA
jgi:hypothetical protein